jgi:hypothetical protein
VGLGSTRAQAPSLQSRRRRRLTRTGLRFAAGTQIRFKFKWGPGGVCVGVGPEGAQTQTLFRSRNRLRAGDPGPATGATVPPHAVCCGQAGHRQEESLRPLRSVGAQLRWASGCRSRADSRQLQMAAAFQHIGRPACRAPLCSHMPFAVGKRQ